jgi:phage FluMu protein gp41
MTTPLHVSDGRPDGLMVGQSATDKVGFFGTTPADQRASSAQAAITLVTATTSSPAGLVTVSGMQQLCNQVEEIRATLAELGLFKGAA